MRKWANGVGRATLLILITALGDAMLAEQAPHAGIHPLHSKRAEILEMSGIMRDMAAEMGVSRNAQIARDMHHIAERCAEYLDTTEALLKLYESLSAERERRLALGTLYLRLLIHLREFDARIYEVSEGLASASDRPMKAALAREGLRLQQRLSEARDKLKDLEVEMKQRVNRM
jgi:hypothetical protein